MDASFLKVEDSDGDYERIVRVDILSESKDSLILKLKTTSRDMIKSYEPNRN